MVITRQCNDPTYKPPPYFCPILDACAKGGRHTRGILWYYIAIYDTRPSYAITCAIDILYQL